MPTLPTWWLRPCLRDQSDPSDILRFYGQCPCLPAPLDIAFYSSPPPMTCTSTAHAPTDPPPLSHLPCSSTGVSYRYHLAVSPLDGTLYVSDPEAYQILRVRRLRRAPRLTENLEAVVGSGERCPPGDEFNCGDGGRARHARLTYPKGTMPWNKECVGHIGTSCLLYEESRRLNTWLSDEIFQFVRLKK